MSEVSSLVRALEAWRGEALRAAGRAGRKPKLNPLRLEAID
jgi:hypothetical protein